MINFYRSLVFLFIALVVSFTAHGQWERSTGTATAGLCFASVPDGAGGYTLFAGNDGVFRSTDDGTSWVNTGPGLPSAGVSALATNGTHLFAGTWGYGVYSSNDNGAAWGEVNNLALANSHVTALVATTGGSASYIIVATSDHGVYRTGDNGTTWAEADTGMVMLNWGCASLAVSSDLPGNVFAATDYGVFRSTDNGAHWLSTGLHVAMNTINARSTGSGTGVEMFAGAENGHVYYYDGTTWTARDITGSVALGSVNCFTFNGSNVFAGVGYIGGGAFLSTNNGTNWWKVSYGMTWEFYSYVYEYVIIGERIIAATRDGIWWRHLPITTVITNPISNEVVIANEPYDIRWEAVGITSLRIEVSIDSGLTYQTIATNVQASANHFTWTFGDDILSRKCKIKISDTDDPTISAKSGLFRIKPYVLTRLNDDSTYYAYRKDRDQWGFRNTPEDMWPETWYNQFDYQEGTDPFTNMLYSQIQGDCRFANSRSNLFADWVSFVNTFTVGSCYFSTVNGLYKPSALLKWGAESLNWRGSCFGIATANALAFRYKDQFQNKYPNFPSFINPITVVSDTGVKRVVNELQNHQFGKPHTTYWSNIGIKKTPTQTLAALKEMFKEDNAQIRTLGFNNNGEGGGGHEILAYGLEKDSVNANLFYIKVYDNSNPNSNNRITINTSANGGSGSWDNPDWPGWGGNLWFYLRNPTVEYLTNPTMDKASTKQSPFILDDDELEINNTISASIQIRDNIGNLSGFYNNLILLDIPYSIPLIVYNGSETPPYGYSLPADNYSVVLSDFAEDTVNTFFFTGNKSFVYERSGATQTQTDRLFFDGGVSVTNPDVHPKTVKLLNLINETTQEKLCVARSLELVQNDSVKIENPDSNKVKLISYGSAKEYDIELNYVTENGIGRFGDFDVHLAANTSHTFVPDWSDITNTELMVLVDIGNDGIIDDTLSLVNQITGMGDDQGSFLAPNSYNLAQNYPNPFNPNTVINYSVPKTSLVTIKVYDILGREVATLVNEEKVQGFYFVTFDASHLSSGVYFYKLQANNFAETKKLILLK